MGAFGNHTLSDLSGFFSENNALSSEKNPLRSLRVRLPNATYERVRSVRIVTRQSMEPDDDGTG
jgi:hypothetical protein